MDRQFSELCRILVDPQRPMNHKVKLAWLDYLNELLPSMEASDFTDCSGVSSFHIISELPIVLHVHVSVVITQYRKSNSIEEVNYL